MQRAGGDADAARVAEMMQMVGASCVGCGLRLAVAAEGERCHGCAEVFHTACARADACPGCGASRASRPQRACFARACPACSRPTGQRRDRTCRACGAAVGWDDAAEFARYRQACRAQAPAPLLRGVAQILPVALIVVVGVRSGYAAALAGGGLVLGAAVLLPFLTASAMLLVMSVRNLWRGVALLRSVALRRDDGEAVVASPPDP